MSDRPQGRPLMWWLAVLILPAGWLYMHHWYKKIWGHSLRWWAIPFAQGALLFSRRLDRWER